MKAPDYDWVCQNCKRSNPANTSACAACAFPAVYTVKALRGVSPEPGVAPRMSADTDMLKAFWLFFPEVIPAAIVAISAPLWAAKLFANDHPLAAIALLSGDLFAGYGFVKALLHERKGLAYLVMLAFLLLAYVVESSTH